MDLYYFDESKVCTCEHKHEEHGWEHCDVPGCPCQAKWEKEETE